MPKKIKLVDLARDTFVWSNPDIIDITFSNPTADLENGQLIQKTEITIDKDIEIQNLKIWKSGNTQKNDTNVDPKDDRLD